MMRLVLSALREIICRTVFVSVPVVMDVMEHSVTVE